MIRDTNRWEWNAMLLEHAKILFAVRASGEIAGRKKFQKMIYIAKKLNFPFQEKFDFHFFGPYSEELSLRIEELVNMGFLVERAEKIGGYVQYRYSITGSGEEFLKMFPLEEDFPFLKPCFLDMNEKSGRFLELVSTVLYFESLPKFAVTEKIHSLKSKQGYTEEEIDQAYEYIARLKELYKADDDSREKIRM